MVPQISGRKSRLCQDSGNVQSKFAKTVLRLSVETRESRLLKICFRNFHRRRRCSSETLAQVRNWSPSGGSRGWNAVQADQENGWSQAAQNSELTILTTATISTATIKSLAVDAVSREVLPVGLKKVLTVPLFISCFPIVDVTHSTKVPVLPTFGLKKGDWEKCQEVYSSWYDRTRQTDRIHKCKAYRDS